MTTSLGTITLKIEADLSPIAAGNFVALASCGYYDGVVFHRVVPGFVIQGGDPTGTGTRWSGLYDPGRAGHGDVRTAARSPWRGPRHRTRQGSQFFIVLDDSAAQSLASYNTYRSSAR